MCTRRVGRHQLLVGFGATVGREPGAMAGFSCAASSATASGSDPKWHWQWHGVEDEARHWGSGGGVGVGVVGWDGGVGGGGWWGGEVGGGVGGLHTWHINKAQAHQRRQRNHGL